MLSNETSFELLDLTLILEALIAYQKDLCAYGRRPTEKQQMMRMLLEKAVADWRKEWCDI